jgi:hypothetical protein
MIQYLEMIIMHSIHNADYNNSEIIISSIPPTATSLELDIEFS